MTLKFEHKKWFVFIISILLITNLTILLDIPFLRQILGFLFLTLLPGLLILQILKLNKIEFTEKFVLSVGLSISFLMFSGLLINNLSLSLGYETPLSTISLLIPFNIAFVVLTIIGCKTNREPIFSLLNLNLSVSEKAFLIVPIMFPALSIYGMHLMNTADNNIILMFLLFSIPTYVIFVCFFNHKFSKRLYPVVIFLISISILLLYSLRSNHLIGTDTHVEYYLFRTTLSNLHWGALRYGNQLDACLVISLLPTIYQLFLNISPEFLYKILYLLLYSISPLVIYVISKRYVGESYGFLAACFFMFQANFLRTASNARTNIAILFLSLAIMVLFSDKIDPLKKRIIFIVFTASCMVSHYSTTYIFFFILLGAFIGMEVLSKKYTFKKAVSLTLVILFFAMIFFWYSQLTETAFNKGVGFIENTFLNLNRFFVEELRSEQLPRLFGEGIKQDTIPNKIDFVSIWLAFAFIAIGVITTIIRYKQMSFKELNFKKPDFLKKKFEVGYLVIAVVCSGLLVVTIVLPFISRHYGMGRLYNAVITILSVFFVIGGIMLSKQTFKKHFFFFKKRKPVLKEKNNCFFGKAFFSKEETFMTHGDTHEHENNKVFSYQRFEGKNASEVRAYLIILLVLIPQFLSCTGVTDQMFGYPHQIILNSEGEMYDIFFIHDQESYSAKWLWYYTEPENLKIYTDYPGDKNLISQAGILPSAINRHLLLDERDIKIKGYIYLRYHNVVNGKLVGRRGSGPLVEYNMTQYRDKFVGKGKIYNNGCTEVYK